MTEQFKCIDIHQAKALLEERAATIIDIRDEDSYQTAHIQGARSVTDANVEDFLQSADKDKPLLCYCYLGNSSQAAAEYFSQNGFKEVYSLQGGFEGWKTVYPVVGERI